MSEQAKTKTVSLSLARWHKVLERLSNTIATLEGQAAGTLSGVSASAYLGTFQVSELQAEGENGWRCLLLARTMNDWRAELRDAVAGLNARSGISGKLAGMESVKRELAFLARVLCGHDFHAVDPEGLQAVFASQAGCREIDHKGQVFIGDYRSVHVRLLPLPRKAELEQRKVVLEKRLLAYQDELAELNQTRLKFDVPLELSEYLGL